MNEKMMEHEMDMVDGIWMDENEATNLASCLPHYYINHILTIIQVSKQISSFRGEDPFFLSNSAAKDDFGAAVHVSWVEPSRWG